MGASQNKSISNGKADSSYTVIGQPQDLNDSSARNVDRHQL
jgi:hypothetical protein